MRPNALKVLAAWDEAAPLARLVRQAGLSPENTSRAVSELASLGLARKRRRGISVVVEPLPHPAWESLKQELHRFPKLDLAAVARGRRAALIAGLGHARPAFLRSVTGYTQASLRAGLEVLEKYGALAIDRDVSHAISLGHEPLQSFCQAICDLETRQWLNGRGVATARVLWSRSCEALIAVLGPSKVPPSLKPAAYTAAAKRGIAFLGLDQYYLLSRRQLRWPDTLLHCLLVPPLTKLTRTHAVIMYASKRREPLDDLSRWYGVEEDAARVVAFVAERRDDPAIFPRWEVRDIAEQYGVRL